MKQIVRVHEMARGMQYGRELARPVQCDGAGARRACGAHLARVRRRHHVGREQQAGQTAERRHIGAAAKEHMTHLALG